MSNIIKVAVGGSLVKKEIKALLEKLSNQTIKADIFTDMDVSAKVKSGEYDFYMGSCQSGAGGSLAMAYAIIGRDKYSTIANAVKKPRKNRSVKILIMVLKHSASRMIVTNWLLKHLSAQ